MSPESVVPDVHLEYFVGEGDHDSHWLFNDMEGNFIAEFTNPNLKKVFQAGYAYAMKKSKSLTFAQNFVDEFAKIDAKVVDVKQTGPLEVELVMDNGKVIRATGLFASKIKEACL